MQATLLSLPELIGLVERDLKGWEWRLQGPNPTPDAPPEARYRAELIAPEFQSVQIGPLPIAVAVGRMSEAFGSTPEGALMVAYSNALAMTDKGFEE